MCSVFAGFTLAFASQLRKKHGKISVNDNIGNGKNHFMSRVMEIRQKKCSTNFKSTLHRYSVDKPSALLTVNFRAVQRTS
jgi:hypothetical protein